MKVIRITKDTSMKELDFKTDKNFIKNLMKNSISQGNKNIKLLYTWDYNANIIECYGWYEGEHGFENKHDLPPYGKSNIIENDSSEQLLFGDIFIVKKNYINKLLNITMSEYCDFYNFAMGGFDDCDSSLSENESYTSEIDPDYIVDEKDKEIEEDEEDEEYLDYDENNYEK